MDLLSRRPSYHCEGVMQVNTKDEVILRTLGRCSPRPSDEVKKQVSDALVILAPEQTDRNECRDDIQSILVIVEGIRVHVDFIKDRSSYKSIIAIPTYEAALRRLVNAGDALTKYWRSQLYPDELVGLLKDAINRCKPAVPGPAQAAPKASRSARGSSQ